MAQLKEYVLRFRNPPDAVRNNIRVRPANTVAAYDDPVDQIVPPPPNSDGFTRIPLVDIPQARDLPEGRYDFHITALDAAGHESDFLEVDNQDFDLTPPAAPTDGALEAI